MVVGSALGWAELYGSLYLHQSHNTGDHRVAPRAPPRGAAWLEDRGTSSDGVCPVRVPGGLRAFPDSSSQGLTSRRIPQTVGTPKNQRPRAREH